jgi:hypothetical protein
MIGYQQASRADGPFEEDVAGVIRGLAIWWIYKSGQPVFSHYLGIRHRIALDGILLPLGVTVRLMFPRCGPEERDVASGYSRGNLEWKFHRI